MANDHASTFEIFILLAHGFDTASVTAIATSGRQAGQAVALVGLTAGPLRSDWGLQLCPDRTLEQVRFKHTPILFIPGGKACVNALLRDPRVHRLCQEVWENQGQVVTEPGMKPILETAGLRVTDDFKAIA